jgi:hypothetical protein
MLVSGISYTPKVTGVEVKVAGNVDEIYIEGQSRADTLVAPAQR